MPRCITTGDPENVLEVEFEPCKLAMHMRSQAFCTRISYEDPHTTYAHHSITLHSITEIDIRSDYKRTTKIVWRRFRRLYISGCFLKFRSTELVYNKRECR